MKIFDMGRCLSQVNVVGLGLPRAINLVDEYLNLLEETDRQGAKIMRLLLNPSLPPGTVVLRNREGDLARVVNAGGETHAP